MNIAFVTAAATDRHQRVRTVVQVFLNPRNTVYDAKRLVGRKFSAADVQDDLANMNWPFLVKRGSGDKPTITGEGMK